MPFPPSAACRFFDLPPVNLQNLPLHLTKNSFASAPTHLCGIALTDFILPIGRRLLLRRESFHMLLQIQSLPASHGRGGSVSRRDLKQAYRRRAHLTGGTKQEETYRPKRQLLFGREREGGASLREADSLAYLAFLASLAYLPKKSREIVQGFCSDCSCFLG